MTQLMHHFLNIDRLAERQNSDPVLPVAYNISVIDTPVIYVGSGAAAASNMTEALIIIRETLNDSRLESRGKDEFLRSPSFSPDQSDALDWYVFQHVLTGSFLLH